MSGPGKELEVANEQRAQKRYSEKVWERYSSRQEGPQDAHLLGRVVLTGGDPELNGVLPSNACSTIPSKRSPSEMSRHSARPFSTFSVRFSSRTPVWTRSMVFMLSWYTDNMFSSTPLQARWRIRNFFETFSILIATFEGIREISPQRRRAHRG